MVAYILCKVPFHVSISTKWVLATGVLDGLLLVGWGGWVVLLGFNLNHTIDKVVKVFDISDQEQS